MTDAPRLVATTDDAAPRLGVVARDYDLVRNGQVIVTVTRARDDTWQVRPAADIAGAVSPASIRVPAGRAAADVAHRIAPLIAASREAYAAYVKACRALAAEWADCSREAIDQEGARARQIDGKATGAP